MKHDEVKEEEEKMEVEVRGGKEEPMDTVAAAQPAVVLPLVPPLQQPEKQEEEEETKYIPRLLDAAG